MQRLELKPLNSSMFSNDTGEWDRVVVGYCFLNCCIKLTEGKEVAGMILGVACSRSFTSSLHDFDLHDEVRLLKSFTFQKMQRTVKL